MNEQLSTIYESDNIGGLCYSNSIVNRATMFMDCGGKWWIEYDWTDNEGRRYITKLKCQTQ